MSAAVELTCYVYPGWNPQIRPASPRRKWMDDTPESFAYRCLPLGIANSHGWEILNPYGFEAIWDGSSGTEGVTIKLDEGVPEERAAVSLFGQGTITFHIEAILRTSPGWNLWVSGSPNDGKDGIVPLGAIIETDWSPYTFTMNWRFTRKNHLVRFEAGEPFCFIFPIQRGPIDSAEPKIRSIDDEEGLREKFEYWSSSRDRFNKNIEINPPIKPSEKWQKLYYRGVNPDGGATIVDHQTKLRVCPFTKSD